MRPFIPPVRVIFACFNVIDERCRGGCNSGEGGQGWVGGDHGGQRLRCEGEKYIGFEGVHIELNVFDLMRSKGGTRGLWCMLCERDSGLEKMEVDFGLLLMSNEGGEDEEALCCVLVRGTVSLRRNQE